MRVKIMVFFHSRAAIFVLFFMLLLFSSLTFSDVRHVYYGENCLTHGGNKDCNGWTIAIHDNSIQSFISTAKDHGEINYPDIKNRISTATAIGAATGIAVGLGLIIGENGITGLTTMPSLANLAEEFIAATRDPSLLYYAVIGAVPIVGCTLYHNDTYLLITDPLGTEKKWPVTNFGTDYIEHQGATGNVILNQPANGDVIINSSSY